MPIFDIEIERRVIGYLTCGDEYLGEAIVSLAIDDFSQKEFKTIFEAIKEMYQNGEQITPQTFYIKHGAMLREIGINSWSSITDVFASMPDLKAAIARLKEANQARHLMALSDLIRENLEAGSSAQDVQSKIEAILLKCGDTSSDSRKYISPKEMAVKCLEVVAERMDQSTREKKCIYTGFKALNKATGGLEGGDLIILSAETGRGKSAFAANLAQNIGIIQRMPLLYLNSEMSDEQMALRWSALLGCISHTSLRAGTITQDEYIKLTSRLDAYNSGQVHTLTVPDLRIEKVLSEVRRFKAQQNIRLAIVDYIGRCDFMNSKEEDWKLLTGAARKLKTLAQEQQLVIIMLAQLNASGRLAQASYMSHEADLWLNLRNPNDDEQSEFAKNREPWNTVLEIVKARNSKLGTIPLYFAGDRLLFTDNEQEAFKYAAMAS